MAYRTEVLREVWRITERRDGAVYKTEFVERRWILLDLLGLQTFESRPDGDPDLLWASVSTDYEGPTMRSMKVEDQ